MSKKRPSRQPIPKRSRRGLWAVLGVVAVFAVIALTLLLFTEYESYQSLYDAEYVGAEVCGECHGPTYRNWQLSPHANMARPATAGSVVGDFDDGTWTLPPELQRVPGDEQPAAHMYREGNDYYMALRHPATGQFISFKIDYAIGYQYRQTYLTLEPGGVLRRLPLQWSTARQEFFPYWNYQENSASTVEDLWAQMATLNSAWNLFCARCHTTHLVINNKDADHTMADVAWVDDGIACEACHGPGSQHVNYFDGNYVNRIAAFVNSRIRGQPVAYVANPPKLEKGQDLSTCARCHGTDIFISQQDTYRTYEPGYSREGRINDLSPYFYETPLNEGRNDFTVETWADGRPKGIGMLFRSFVESTCYQQAEVRCYECHDPHNNKLPASPGMLVASRESNAWCLECHGELADRIAEHSGHEAGTAGSFCYDCHMPKEIVNIVAGVPKMVRTHQMSSIPNPSSSIEHGLAGAPNACSECHSDQTPQWAQERMAAMWPEG